MFLLNPPPVDREERLEAVERGAGPRPHLESGRADQDEGDHGEDRHGLGRGHHGLVLLRMGHFLLFSYKIMPKCI